MRPQAQWVMSDGGVLVPGGGSGISLVGYYTLAMPSSPFTIDYASNIPDLQDGDYVVVTFTRPGSGAHTVPTTWAQQLMYAYGTNTVAATKFYDAVTDDGYPISDGTSINNVGPAIVAVFRGVDQTTPQDATLTYVGAGSGMPNPPSITTVTGGAWVLALGGLDDDSLTSVTAPSGYENAVSKNTTTDRIGTMMLATKEIASPGAEDPSAFGGSGTDLWVGASMALRPA